MTRYSTPYITMVTRHLMLAVTRCPILITDSDPLPTHPSSATRWRECNAGSDALPYYTYHLW